jgi:hypothetical protein
MAEKTRTFKLKEGVGKHEHAVRNEKGEITERKVIESGETAELTQAQYEAFRDKFETTDGKEDDDWRDPVLTATQPQADGKDTSSPKAPGADKAAEDNENAQAEAGKTGAGASENSSNTATVPGGGTKGSAPTTQNTTGQQIQNKGGTT